MKRLFLLFGLACCFTLLHAQEEEASTAYLFDKFQDVTVIFKNGAQYQEKMNYNILIDNFCFIDRADGQIKELSNPQDVNVIKFGNRVFYPEHNGGIEILPTNPVLYVQYCGHIRKEASKGAYGMASETTSIRTFGAANAEGGMRFEFDPEKLIVGKRYNIYWIEKKGKKKPIRNFKQFIKHYPEHKEALNEFINKNDVDFNNVDHMKMLLIYAEGL